MPLRFDLKKCTGCKLCQLACSAVHDQVFNPEKARLQIIHEYTQEGIQIKASQCILCLECEKACPEDAISNNGHWMTVDVEKCIGCGTCVDTCPQNIICLGTDSNAVICDLCEGSPKCIDWCPKGVISLKEKKIKSLQENIQ
jgi:Fe-S-cluster-containing hydrogenase component 2